ADNPEGLRFLERADVIADPLTDGFSHDEDDGGEKAREFSDDDVRAFLEQVDDTDRRGAAGGVRLPGAVWKPFTNRSVSTTPLVGPRAIIEHTMGVGTMLGSWSWHNRPGNPYTHTYYDGIGNRVQVQGVDRRAAGTLEGNPYVIAKETEDTGKYFPGGGRTCGNIPAWRQEQLRVIALDDAWCCRRFGIPAVLMPNSCAGTRGIGYHRLGIDPWRFAGCLRYSSARGKCCPDVRRIAQMPALVRAIAALVTPLPPPAITGAVRDMASFFFRTAGKEWRLYDAGVIIDLPYEQSSTLTNQFIEMIDGAVKHQGGKALARYGGISAMMYAFIDAAGQNKRDQAPGFVATVSETGERYWVAADRSWKIAEKTNPDEFAAIVWVVTSKGFQLIPETYSAAQLEDIPGMANTPS
ncbi:MAG: hypothetical protein ACRD0W_17175, partial [Acidimicrobiales bacterium]